MSYSPDWPPRQKFLDPTSVSSRLYQQARRVMPGGNTRTTVFAKPYPIYAHHGKGYLVVDVEGEERLDFLNNYTTLIHGHADPKVIEAVTEQLHRGSCFALPTEPEVRLATLLTERVASVEQVRFMNSGTEAVMMALKAARAFTGRTKIAKCEGTFHGSYEHVEISLAPDPPAWGEPEAPTGVPFSEGVPPRVAEEVVVVPFNNVEVTERLLNQHKEDLAGVILDPLPSRPGLIPASQAYVQMLRQWTRDHGSLLIFDEIISFRLAYHGAQSLWGVQPDLTTFGKIIGGGFPVGAVGGARDVMAVFDPSVGKPKVAHYGTFNANPITMVAGLATMEQLTPEAFPRLNDLGDRLRERAAQAFARAGVPGRMVGMGSLFFIHLNDRPLVDYRSSYRGTKEQAMMAELYRRLVLAGILIGTPGFGCLSTPMTEADIETFGESLEWALRGLKE